jgi:hypothetical protein
MSATEDVREGGCQRRRMSATEDVREGGCQRRRMSATEDLVVVSFSEMEIGLGMVKVMTSMSMK